MHMDFDVQRLFSRMGISGDQQRAGGSGSGIQAIGKQYCSTDRSLASLVLGGIHTLVNSAADAVDLLIKLLICGE